MSLVSLGNNLTIHENKRLENEKPGLTTRSGFNFFKFLKYSMF